MTAVRWLHLRRLRQHPLRSLVAVLGVAAGVAFTVAVMIGQATMDQSLAQVYGQLAGPAGLRIDGPVDRGGLTPAVVERVAAVPGVDAVVPMVRTVTVVDTADGDEQYVIALGVDCRVEHLVGPLGCDPAALDSDVPLVSPSLGTTGSIRTNTVRVPMSGAVQIPQLDEFNHGRVVVFALPAAQRLFARGDAFDTAYVVGSAGTDEVEAAAGEHVVVSNGTSAPPATPIPTPILPLLYLFSTFGLVIGGQLVHNVINLSLEERRRELAVIGAVGGRPRLLVGGTIVEGATLGLIGGLTGVGLGTVLVRPFRDDVSAIPEQFLGIRLDFYVPTWVVVAGVLVGVFGAVLASLVAVRRVARLELAAELHERRGVGADGRDRALVKLVALVAVAAAGVGLVLVGSFDGSIERWQPPVARAGFLLSTAIVSASGPATRLAVGRLGRSRLAERGPLGVAVGNLAGDPKRAGFVGFAVAASVATALVLGSIGDVLVAGVRHEEALELQGRALVTTLDSGAGSTIDAKFTPELVAAVASVPGVARVDREFEAIFFHPTLGDVFVKAMEGTQPEHHVFQGRSADEALARNEVLLGPGLARATGLRPGDTIEIPGRDGIVPLIVGAIWREGNDLGRSIQLRPDTFRQLWGDRPPDNLGVTPDPGVSTTEVAARIREARLDPVLQAFDEDALADDYARLFRQFLIPFWALQRGMLLSVVIVVVSTTLLAAIQRRREHGTLAAVGMGPGDLGRMILAEAGLVGLLGSLFGALFGLVQVLALVPMSPLLTGVNGPVRVAWSTIPLYGAVATLAMLAAAALPAARVARVDPAIALRYE
ncbi:MAG: FtsX-like permease family protein [Acidimicrobiales bacterium]